MKSRWFVKIAAIVCAVCLAVGVMSQTVFARDDSPYQPQYTAEEPEATFVVLGGEASPAPTATDNRLSLPLYVKGVQVGQCSVVNGEPYMAVSEFCQALGMDNVQLVDNGLGVSLAADGVMLTARTDQSYVMCNERYLYLENGARLMNGAVALPVETLVRCMGLTAYWDRVQWMIRIDGTQLSPLQSGAAYYNDADVYWLSRLIFAMTADEPMDAKIAVGDVCVNRLGDERFAGQNNIYEVVFAKNQFEVVTNGMIYVQPDEDSVIAAKLALEGYDLTNGAAYVARGGLDGERECVANVGDLQFFAEA